MDRREPGALLPAERLDRVEQQHQRHESREPADRTDREYAGGEKRVGVERTGEERGVGDGLEDDQRDEQVEPRRRAQLAELHPRHGGDAGEEPRPDGGHPEAPELLGGDRLAARRRCRLR